MPQLLNFSIDITGDDYSDTMYSAFKAVWDNDGAFGVVTHYRINGDTLTFYWQAPVSAADAREICPLPFPMDGQAALDLARSWIRAARPTGVPLGDETLHRREPVFHVRKDSHTMPRTVCLKVTRVWGVYAKGEV